MKKMIPVMMAVVFAFSVAGLAFAAEKAPAAAPAAEKAPVAKKAVSQSVTGTIEALDAAAGTLTVKGGKKGNVDLKAGEKVKLDTFKVGDKVVVKYAGGIASTVKVVKGKTAKPAEPKADAKPAEKAAEKK
jgi:glucose dehydrogenase